jgi:hypothetical protein
VGIVGECDICTGWRVSLNEELLGRHKELLGRHMGACEAARGQAPGELSIFSPSVPAVLRSFLISRDDVCRVGGKSRWGELQWRGPDMRLRFKQTTSLKERLLEEVKRARELAEGMPPSPKRDRLLKKARQSDTVAHINEWLTSRGLQPAD